jgi:SHS2 domain-containing protein
MTTTRKMTPTLKSNDAEGSGDGGKKWKFLEHTADVRMEVYGATLEELFLHAAEGFADLVGSTARIVEDSALDIDLEAGELEELLVDWLRELHYQHETRGFLFSGARIEELTPKKVKARLKGGIRSLDDERDMEIKGVTYHAISVEKTDSGYSARIVFDI